jgi:hypothetical protein
VANATTFIVNIFWAGREILHPDTKTTIPEHY